MELKKDGNEEKIRDKTEERRDVFVAGKWKFKMNEEKYLTLIQKLGSNVGGQEKGLK